MWERWDGWSPEHGLQTPAMNSFNHYAFGSVGEWLYEWMGGLRPEPWAWYAVVMGLAVLAGVLPYRWASRRSDRVFATWLDRTPSRRAELVALRDGWPRDLKTFGEIPD